MKDNPVLVNGRFTCAPETGVQRYARNVAARLGLPSRMIAPQRNPGRLGGQLWEQMLLPRRVERGSLLWSPANSGPVRVRAQVVTIHDVAVLEHPEWFAPAFAVWYRWLLPRLTQAARRVITVSHFSKDHIQAVLNVPAGRITVASPGVADGYRPAAAQQVAAVRAKYRLAATYFLTVGTLEPRKNLPGLLSAWEMIRLQTGNAELVLCGVGRRNFRSVDLGSPAPRVKPLGYVPEADLPALYSGAMALILPSFYEGYGLPALEALACGTAVIVSRNAGICGEVQAGMLPVDPQTSESIAAALVRVWEDADLRRMLGEQGRETVAGFRWEQTAAITTEVLRQAAEEAG